MYLTIGARPPGTKNNALVPPQPSEPLSVPHPQTHMLGRSNAAVGYSEFSSQPDDSTRKEKSISINQQYELMNAQRSTDIPVGQHSNSQFDIESFHQQFESAANAARST